MGDTFIERVGVSLVDVVFLLEESARLTEGEDLFWTPFVAISSQIIVRS